MVFPVRVLLLCMGACGVLASALPGGDTDLSCALEGARGGDRPVLVLVRDPRQVATLDAGYWIRDLPGSGPASQSYCLATEWRDALDLDRFRGLRRGGLFLLDGTGQLIARVSLPPLRSQLKPLIDEALADLTPLEVLAAQAETGRTGDETTRRAWSRLVSAGQSERAVRLLARPENALLARRLAAEMDLPLREELSVLRESLTARRDEGQPAGRASMCRLLDRSLDHTSTLRCVELLAHAVCRWGGRDEIKRLRQMIERNARAGRASAQAALFVGDARFSLGEADEAGDWWKLAERAAEDGESPVLFRAARRRRAAVDGKDTTRRSRWYKREVLDVVVLVSDVPSFARAVSRWTEKRFFPVLFVDRVLAPRFLNAFRPSRVIVVPSAGGGPALGEDDIRRAVVSSWLKAGDAGRLPPHVGRAALLDRLRSFGDDPQGVVFTQTEAGEMPGALALAAGRFQGIEFLGAGMAAEKVTLSAVAVRALAKHMEAGLRRWGLPRDGHNCTVTLAGGYPLCYEVVCGGQHRRLAVDDWIGRAADGGRLAFTGRLTNGRVASAYAAACSLFLQPGATSVVRASDLPDGGPATAVFTPKGAGRDPDDLGTLCGRGIQAGLFWCAGSVDGAPAETWPSEGAWKGWMRQFAPWGCVFRRGDGQAFGWPGRTVIYGDPLFGLRRERARRRDVPDDGPLVRGDERRLSVEGPGTDFGSDVWLTTIDSAGKR